MPQNRISLRLLSEDVTDIEGAIATMEQRLTGLIGLQPEERRELTKMGDKSEVFCRAAVTTLRNHPDVLPRGFSVEEYEADLAVLDPLRPLLNRLQRLFDRMVDTEMALGSDILGFALDGYAVAKVIGKGAALATMKEAMSARYTRRRSEPPKP